MNELVVISGKGGTGKTSVAASLAILAREVVVADCDVDAADLHLILAPQVIERHDFRSGRTAAIRHSACSRCGACIATCRFEAISRKDDSSGALAIDPLACEGCGVCALLCPSQAIAFEENTCGQWMISETRCGPMVHARLHAAAENSGKLVSIVRAQARQVAEQHGLGQIIIDGPPGLGCPVIASLSGATRVLAVSEPTVSGAHDLQRVMALSRQFRIPLFVCINKWDLNPDMAERIEREAVAAGASVAGRIPYDPAVTQAQIQGRAVVEFDSPAAEEIRGLWSRLQQQQPAHAV